MPVTSVICLASLSYSTDCGKASPAPVSCALPKCFVELWGNCVFRGHLHSFHSSFSQHFYDICRVQHEGISVKTQELYLLVFVCRYLDLFDNYSTYNTIFKVMYITVRVITVSTWHSLIAYAQCKWAALCATVSSSLPNRGLTLHMAFS